MKKFLMLLLGIGLVISMAGSVAADNVVGEFNEEYTNAGDLPHQVVVSYDLATQKYTVTIPSSFDFTDYGTQANTIVSSSVTAKHVILENNKMLVIGVKSTHNWNLTEHDRTSGEVVPNAAKIPYSMKFPGLTTTVTSDKLDNPTVIADATNPNYEDILYVPTGVDLLTAVLEFELLNTPDSTGLYKDALTFNIQIKDQPTTT